MSASKIKHEFRTICNFDSVKINKYQIYKTLKKTDILIKESSDQIPIVIENQINIGKYIIRLILNNSKKDFPHSLRDYGKFTIKILEEEKELNLKRAHIFRNESWVQKNQDGELTISDLIQVILYCARVDRLKTFN